MIISSAQFLRLLLTRIVTLFSVPPNLRFEIDDIEDEWTFSRPFDYIHSRFMTAGIRDWKLFLQRCFE